MPGGSDYSGGKGSGTKRRQAAQTKPWAVEPLGPQLKVTSRKQVLELPKGLDGQHSRNLCLSFRMRAQPALRDTPGGDEKRGTQPAC